MVKKYLRVCDWCHTDGVECSNNGQIKYTHYNKRLKCVEITYRTEWVCENCLKTNDLNVLVDELDFIREHPQNYNTKMEQALEIVRVNHQIKKI